MSEIVFAVVPEVLDGIEIRRVKKKGGAKNFEIIKFCYFFERIFTMKKSIRLLSKLVADILSDNAGGNIYLF